MRQADDDDDDGNNNNNNNNNNLCLITFLQSLISLIVAVCCNQTFQHKNNLFSLLHIRSLLSRYQTNTLIYYQITTLLTLYRSLNAIVPQPKNCQ
jgi:hypothetical protein